MVQVNSDSNKIKENKYKILRMSLLLGNGEDREETINNFEDAAREIDAMNDEVYLKDLEDKFYDTFKLEEEEKKLSILVDYIGGRVEQRISLLEDFSNVTGYELVNLPMIKYQDRLDEYKSRLKYIREYLNNINRINKLNDEISDFENKLNDSYVKKSRYEEENIKFEEELFNRFKTIIKGISSFDGVEESNIENKLNEVIAIANDSKKSLDIFNKSFSTLNQAGISDNEKKEYLSYVNGAKELYYSNKEDEYLLRIYSLLSGRVSEYSELLAKRDALNEIITERLSLRKELNVKGNDILNGLYDILDRQYNDIREESININNIDNYASEINSRKIEVSGLEQDNQKVEILALLREFCIIDNYDDVKDNDNVDGNDELVNNDIFEDNSLSNSVENVTSNDEDLVNNEDNIFENVISNDNIFENDVKDDDSNNLDDSNNNNLNEEVKNDDVSLDVENAKDNQVVMIEDATKLDIKAASDKSNSVMMRVGEMLGVKIEKNDDDTNKNLDDNNLNEDVDDANVDSIFDNNNYDADPENNEKSSNDDTNIEENPLFSNELSGNTLDDVIANNDVSDKGNDEFWYSNEDAPIDLNSLPDLTNNDVENNNDDRQVELPDLEFPDLSMPDLNEEEDK